MQGGVTPLVSNFNATSPGGQTYRALYQVATSEGVNPGAINQGQTTSGKVYFDVTGDNPNTVVYRDAGGSTWPPGPLQAVRNVAPATSFPPVAGGPTVCSRQQAPGTCRQRRARGGQRWDADPRRQSGHSGARRHAFTRRQPGVAG